MTGKRVLLAEDDPITSRFVSSLLAGKGYEVLLAEDGEHAFELAIKARPDLVITDLVMPYRDGLDVVRALRGDARVSDVPVIVLSMRDHETDIVEGLEQGADDYIVKPFNARELLARVRKQLERVRD